MSVDDVFDVSGVVLSVVFDVIDVSDDLDVKTDVFGRKNGRFWMQTSIGCTWTF